MAHMTNPGTFISLPRSALFAVTLLAGTLTVVPAWAEHGGFKDEIFPIIRKYCVECHQPGGEEYKKSGLDMRTYEAIMKGTKYGPIVVPGNALLSNLNVLIDRRAARYLRMPHHGKNLTRWERLLIRRWVNRGAKNN